MSFVLKEFVKGIVLRGENSDITDNIEGSIFYNQTEKRFKAYINNAVQYIVTSPTSGGGSGGADIQLSNIVTTNIPAGVQLNSSSISQTFGSEFELKTSNQTTSNSGNVRVRAGDVSGNFLSGGARLLSGFNTNAQRSSSTTTATGNANIQTGAITGGTLGSTGTAGVFSGSINVPSAFSGDSGIVTMESGSLSANVTGKSGDVVLLSGRNNGSGRLYDGLVYGTGFVAIRSGEANSPTNDGTRSGLISIWTGRSSFGTSGQITILTGEISATPPNYPGAISNISNNHGSTGNISIRSGNITNGDNVIGKTGDVTIASGSHTGSGGSGNVIISTGTTVAGLRGYVSISSGQILLEGKIFSDGGTSLLTTTRNQTIAVGDIDLLNSSGTVYHKDITANTNFQFTNGIAGKRFTVVVKNATGSSWQANFPNVKQKAGTIINTVAANTSSIFEFVNSASEYYCISCINNIVSPTPSTLIYSRDFSSSFSGEEAFDNTLIIDNNLQISGGYTYSSYRFTVPGYGDYNNTSGLVTVKLYITSNNISGIGGAFLVGFAPTSTEISPSYTYATASPQTLSGVVSFNVTNGLVSSGFFKLMLSSFLSGSGAGIMNISKIEIYAGHDQ